jgi:hypothetical protein
VKSWKRYLLAVLAGTAVQPLWAMAWMVGPELFVAERAFLSDFPWDMTLIVATVGGLGVLLVGVPTFQALRAFGRANALWLAAFGFAIVALPMTFLGWPLNPDSGASFGGHWLGRSVMFVDKGIPTSAGWQLYGSTLVIAGLHGAFGALAFLWGWRLFGSDDAVATPSIAAPATAPPA